MAMPGSEQKDNRQSLQIGLQTIAFRSANRACFLWGAAGVHVQEMISAGNFAPGNAGVIFYTDLLLPVIRFLFLWLQAHPGEDTTRGCRGLTRCRSPVSLDRPGWRRAAVRVRALRCHHQAAEVFEIGA